jgi:LPPG:FO 2-phospho-L-lactate transferase
MYTLGGVANVVNGWGLEGDTQQMLAMLRRYGDEAWFGLGDKDVATHLLRTQWLAGGVSLTEVTRRLAAGLNIPAKILPMADQPAPTMIHTVERGVLPFQEYFVRHRWQPTIARLEYLNAGVQPTVEATAALATADLIVICPSNPLLSVEPILSIGYRALLEKRSVPCIAVSPLIGGQAVKGPAAKIMTELQMDASANGVARYYGDLIDGIVIQTGETVEAPRALRTDILMHDVPDRARLAVEILGWVAGWA